LDEEKIKYIRRIVKNQLLLTFYSIGTDVKEIKDLVDSMMQAFDDYFETDNPYFAGGTD